MREHPRHRLNLLAGMILLTSRIAYAQPVIATRDIAGIVVDLEARRIGEAVVTASAGGPFATTASDGSFRLVGVGGAGVVLEVSASGFDSRRMPVHDHAPALQLTVMLASSRSASSATIEAYGAPVATPPVHRSTTCHGVHTRCCHASRAS